MGLPFLWRLGFLRLQAEPGLVSVPLAAGGRDWRPNLDDVQHMYGIAWGQLVQLEPRLETLLCRARMAGTHCRTLPDVERAFVGVRNELDELLGFAGTQHSHPVLGGAGAYVVAYWKLYEAVAERLPGRAGTAETLEGPQGGNLA
jgi:hypothetical protein